MTRLLKPTFLACLCFLAACPVVLAQATPPDVKKTVGFVFGRVHLRGTDGQPQVDGQGRPIMAEVPLGTAFFVAYPDARLGPDKGFGYVITAMHVLKDTDGSLIPSIKIRVNLTERTSSSGFDYVEVPVTDGSGRFVWFRDGQDEANEVVAFPLFPDRKRFDFKTVPVDLFADATTLLKENVSEGDAVFFVGLLPQYYGATRNYPVVRKGSLALMSDDKLPTTTGAQRVYLVEAGSWPGNSGSPVFLDLAGLRGGGLLLGQRLRLLGILLGHYPNLIVGRTVETATVVGGDQANIGIAVVAPAEAIRAVLDSPAARDHRESQIGNPSPARPPQLDDSGG